MLALTPFRVEETHGILKRSGNEIRACSDRYSWTTMYASSQREMPYEAVFPAVKDQLIVLHRDGPVTIDRTRGPAVFHRTVPAGGIHLVPGGAEFGVRLAGVLNTLHVYIRHGVLQEVAADMVEGDPAAVEIVPKVIDRDEALYALLQAVHLALADDDMATALYTDYLSRAIAAQLIRKHSSARLRAQRALTPTGTVSPVISEAIEYMKANMDQPISLADIAIAVNRSPSQFAREFRADLGIPPHRYLINLRLERAQYLLEKTATSIAEIAFECGFAHQEHMTRLFRKRCATTPAAYRRSKRN